MAVEVLQKRSTWLNQGQTNLWKFVYNNTSKQTQEYSEIKLLTTEKNELLCTLYKRSGAPNDGFLSDPLKRYFRLSGVPLKLRRFILGCAITFLSVSKET